MSTAPGNPAYSNPIQPCLNSPGSLSVQVLSKGTCTAVADVRVTIVPNRKLAYTNSEGTVLFERVEPDTYTVSLKLDQYLEDRFELIEAEKVVDVQAGSQSSLTFFLERKACWLSILVEDDDGNPVSDATIRIVYPDDGSSTEVNLNTLTPEADGSYLLSGITETDRTEISLVTVSDDEWRRL